MSKERMHLGAAGPIFDRAQELRKNQTESEKLLWEQLSHKKLGVKFRRQHPILNYIVDFYCHEQKLAIELDGSVHEGHEQHFHDQMRTEALATFGVRVIRFTNKEIHSNIDHVVGEIRKALRR